MNFYTTSVHINLRYTIHSCLRDQFEHLGTYMLLVESLPWLVATIIGAKGGQQGLLIFWLPCNITPGAPQHRAYCFTAVKVIKTRLLTVFLASTLVIIYFYLLTSESDFRSVSASGIWFAAHVNKKSWNTFISLSNLFSVAKWALYCCRG